MKWILYWTSLLGLLFGGLYLKNRHRHSDKTRQWQLGKSAIEMCLLALAAALMPAIIVAYASMWATKNIQRPAFRIGAGFMIGTLLFMTIGSVLEILVIVGIFAIDLVSDDYLDFLKERRQKRGVAMVMDGRAS